MIQVCNNAACDKASQGCVRERERVCMRKQETEKERKQFEIISFLCGLSFIDPFGEARNRRQRTERLQFNTKKKTPMHRYFFSLPFS